MDINQINQIKLSANGNFPELVKRYQEYGIVKFQTCASTAKTMYFDQNGNFVYDETDFFDFNIGEVNVEKFKADLILHQQGVTDFPTWLELTSSSGVAYWIVDLDEKTCIYYDLANNQLYTELIPGA